MKKVLPLFFLFCVVFAHAQSPSLSEIHHMNRRMLGTLDDYARTASLASPEDIRAFLDLFENIEEPCLFNDILGVPGYRTMVSPAAYTRSFDSEAGNILSFELSKVRKQGDYYLESGRWHRRITFDKSILFIDSSVYTGETGGVFFDTKQIYPEQNGSLRLTLDMVYDPQQDRCLITQIVPDGQVPASALDGHSFTVVVRPENEVEGEVLHKASPLVYNEYGQTFLDSRELSFSNDVYAVRPVVEATSDRYDVLRLQYRKLHHFRLKPRYSMTLGQAFAFTDVPEANVNFSPSSKAMEAGLDVGFLFMRGKRARTGLYSGAAYSSSSLEMTGGPFSYEFMEGRNYQISSVTEAYTYTDVMIPLYLESEIRLGNWVNLSLDFGGKFYLAQNTRILTPYQVTGTVNGGNLSLNGEQSGFLDPGYYGKNPYDLSFFANLELDVCVLKNLLYVFAAGGYEYGLQALLPAYQPEEIKSYYMPTGSSPVFPVVYGGGKDLLFRSFSQSISFHRQSIWLSFGLKIKLNI